MNFEDLTATEAVKHIGTPFQLDADDGSALELVLDDVSEHTTGSDDPALQNFSLQFSGPGQPTLPQGTYGFRQGDKPAQAVFIVPVAADDKRSLYEAVFTRV